MTKSKWYLAGKSEIKLNALKLLAEARNISDKVEIIPVDVSTNNFGFAEQPVGYVEALALATIRKGLLILEKGVEAKQDDFFFAVESYIDPNKLFPSDVSLSLVNDLITYEQHVLSEHLELDYELFQEYLKKVDRNKHTFGKFLESKNIIKDSKNPHQCLSEKSREQWIFESLNNQLPKDYFDCLEIF